MRSQKALLVGINHYDFAPPLTGCIHDANHMTSLLEKHADRENPDENFQCTTLLSGDFPNKRITRSKLFNELGRLLLEPAKGELDVALFYYSGHGFANKVGGYLVTQESRAEDDGLSVTDLITMANKSKVKEVIIILDCCFSGTAGKMGGLNDDVAMLRNGVSILTATTDKQTAKERAGLGGEFTTTLKAGLNGLAADYFGKVTLPLLYQFAWMQREYGHLEQDPTLKTNLDSNVVLRKVEPELNMDDLSELNEFFPHPENQLRVKERVKDTVYIKQLLDWEKMGIVKSKEQLTLLEESQISKGRAILTRKGKFIHRIQELKRKRK